MPTLPPITVKFAIETVENHKQQLGYPHVFYQASSHDDAVAQIGKMPNLAKARIIEVNRFDWERIENGFFDGWLHQPNLPPLRTGYLTYVMKDLGRRKRHQDHNQYRGDVY